MLYETLRSTIELHIVLHVEPSVNVAQIGADKFTAEEDLADYPHLKHRKFQWGDYPVLVVSDEQDDIDVNIAYIGLNYASNVLKIMLIPSKDAAKETVVLWGNMLNQTKPLNLLDSIKSDGQDLKEGVTVVELASSFLKVIAEKRISDGEIVIALIPCSEGISFNTQEIISCLTDPAFYKGQIIKLRGELTTKAPPAKYNIVGSSTINVMLKEVQEFSIDQKELKNDPDVQLFYTNDVVEYEIS